MKEIDVSQGVIDELQGWYLGKAQEAGIVYTEAIRLLVAKLHRDVKYLRRRKEEGFKTQYDFHAERDMKVIAWAVQQLILHTPADDKAKPERTKPPRPPRQRRQPGEPRTVGPRWNGQPKRGDWAGIELPPGHLLPKEGR